MPDFTVRYSTNFMGPLTADWFEERNTAERWYGGRIDIDGLDPLQYWGGCFEYSLPIMHEHSWALFSEWLESYVTEDLVPLERVFNDFAEETGHNIRWAHEVLDIQPEGKQYASTNT